MLFGEGAAGRLQFGRSHIVGGRIGEVPAERHSFSNAAEVFAINTLGNHKAHIARIRLPVARELVRAERKGERSQTRIVWRVGESIGSWRQLAGQLPGPEAVDFILIGGFDAEQRAGIVPSVAGSSISRPGLASKPAAATNVRPRSPMSLETELKFPV